jgi:hypothetical protein
MASRLSKWFIGVILFAGLGYGVYKTSAEITESRGFIMHLPGGRHALPDAKLMKYATIGFDQVAADYYWITAIQYFANDFWRNQNYPQWRELADLILTLDPKWEKIYILLALVLGDIMGKPEQANEILEPGVEHLPDSWLLPFQIAYNYWYYLGQNDRAGDYLELAATREGHPRYVPTLAVRMRASAGNIKDALQFTQVFIDTAENPDVKEQMIARQGDLLVEEQCQIVDRAAKKYQAKRDSYPASIRILFAEGYLESMPSDPRNSMYWLNNEKLECIADTLPFGKRLRPLLVRTEASRQEEIAEQEEAGENDVGNGE